jgi:hypothetical protein
MNGGSVAYFAMKQYSRTLLNTEFGRGRQLWHFAIRFNPRSTAFKTRADAGMRKVAQGWVN